MTDAVVSPEFFMGKLSTRRPLPLIEYGRSYISRRIMGDKKRIVQKENILRLRKDMSERLSFKNAPSNEINWISEMVAELPLEKWTIEQAEPGVWFFKLKLWGNVRVNLQADREGDAFFSVYKDGESIAMAHGNLRQTVNDINRIAGELFCRK